MKTLKAVLLVEDNPGDARVLREMLNDQGAYDVEVVHVRCLSEAEEQIRLRSVDVILVDLGLPDAHGLEALRRAHAAAPRIPLVVLTGLDDEAMATKALQQGAQDYLVKGQIEPRALLRALRYAIERKSMDDALFFEKERAEVILNCIGHAVACTDVSGVITFLNRSADTLTGWSMEEALGRRFSEIFQIVDSETSQRVPDPMEAAVAENRSVRLPSNCVLLRRDGIEIPIEDSVCPIHDRDGRATGAVLVFRDVSAAREMSRAISHSAQHDFLTGLPNRMLLRDRVGQAILAAGRRSRKVAILFLDLNGFKHINDSLGHAVGDKLLQAVARQLVGCVRSADTVSRQGGDEFVILLSEVEQTADAAVTARRVQQAIARAHPIDNRELHVTSSMGVSVYPDDGLDAETLIKHADMAMYQAKDKGHQSYQFFEAAMGARAVERQSIEEDLRRALQHGEFTLHYQPKINLKTERIIGAEALIRWNHPSRGQVAPPQFIPVAEDCGLMLAIGAWVLREACTQLRVWLNAGLTLGTVAVNISAVEFSAPNFVDGVLATLKDTGIAPTALELELTESVLMKHAPSTERALKRLRGEGVLLALDDFGTGYSSLNYLKTFPVDALKIDQSFIRQITIAPDETPLVTAVIAMGRSLNVRVVAEGVETAQELDFLRLNQCDDAQGFYFGCPVTPEQFARLLKDGLPARIQGLTTEPRRPAHPLSL